MQPTQRPREWAELQNIDFFLEHLARAVERGQVPRESYDRLAPRYLERRAELVAVLYPGSPPVPVPAPAGVAVNVPAASTPPATVSASGGVAMPPAARPVQPREQRPVPWTTILTFTGAFLVIVAAAIFTVATWDLFGVEFKLVFLGVFTAAFYGAGHLVRTRLGLEGGGVALMVVASAMLLFDGWIAIDGYGLQGAWPWVGWLTVCAGVYWFSEVVVGGSFFGVIGAGAQIAWVWLLGEGLAWPLPQRLAGLSVVAVLWSLAARRETGRPGFASLARVLRVAAPVLVVGSLVVFTTNAGMAVADTAFLASALVFGIAMTVVVEFADLPVGVGALGALPLLAGALGLLDRGPASWVHVVLLALAVVAALLYELRRGGWGHGIAAVVFELLAALLLVDLLGWRAEPSLLFVAGVATSWIIASRLASTSGALGAWSIGAPQVAVVTEVGGWLVLLLASCAIPVASEVVPLAGVRVDGFAALVAGVVLACWVIGASVRPRALVGIPLLGMSLYVAAAVMAWGLPELHSALYALGLVVVLAVWFGARDLVARVWRIPAEFVLVAVRGLIIFVLLVGLAAEWYFFERASWQAGVLLGAVALFWAVDALMVERPRIGLAVSSALVVATVMVFAGAASDAPLASWVGPGAALVCACIAGALRARAGWTHWWTWGAGAAALASMLAVPGPTSGSFALACVLAAAVWLAAALLGRIPALAAFAALLGVFSLYALGLHLDLGSWWLVGLLAGACYLLVSALFVPESLLPRAWAGALSLAGFLGMVWTCLIALAAASGDPLAIQFGWPGSGGHELATCVGLLGVLVVIAGIARDVTFAPYVGVALVLVAYLIEVDTLDVGTVEWATTPLSLYVVWAGHRIRVAHSATHGRGTPLPDFLAAAIGLGIPALLAATPLAQDAPWVHLVWAVGLSLLAIGAGVALKVRGYFFGGVAALVFTAIVRSWWYLVAFWWLVLGIIGVAMLVVALTWERQRQLVATATHRVHEALLDWR